MQTTNGPTLEQVHCLIDALPRQDCGSQRPWLLVHYDDRGDARRGDVRRPQ